MRTFEVWSITTGNMYAESFNDEASARSVLKRSQDMWPEDEFGILAVDADGEVDWVDLDAGVPPPPAGGQEDGQAS